MRVNRIIRAGQSRFFRALKLGAPLSWAFTLLVLAFVIGGAWGMKVSVRAGINGIAHLVSAWLEDSVWFLGSGWTDWRWPVGPLFLGVLVVVVFLTKLWPLLGRPTESDHPGREGRRARRWARRVASGAKWVGLYAGNLLWLVKGLPIVLAVGVSMTALIGHLFYSLPFLRITRRKPAAN